MMHDVKSGTTGHTRAETPVAVGCVCAVRNVLADDLFPITQADGAVPVRAEGG